MLALPLSPNICLKQKKIAFTFQKILYLSNKLEILFYFILFGYEQMPTDKLEKDFLKVLERSQFELKN